MKRPPDPHPENRPRPAGSNLEHFRRSREEGSCYVRARARWAPTGSGWGLLWLALSLALVACGTDPLELPGSYGVFRSELFDVPNPEVPDEPIRARIHAPSADGGLSVDEGPFPMVLFMPGFGATLDAYDMYASHLASHGFIVASMDFRLPGGVDGRHDYLARQALYVIDHALGSASPVWGHVDASKIATAGHSLGGKIAFYAAALDSRIEVVMALDPSNGGGPPCFISPEWCNAYPVAPNVETGAIGLLDQVDAASFIMRAAPDAFNPDPQSNAEHFFFGLDGQGAHAVGPPALYFDVGAAGHASWLYLGNPEVPRITRRTLVAWLRKHFQCEPLEAYFTGEIVQRDVAAGIIVAVETRQPS